MEPQLYFKGNKDLFRHLLVFLVSLILILLVLVNYGHIVDLTANVSYAVFPSKKSTEYKKLTAELIALYGSGQVEYYQDTQSTGVISQSNAQSNNALSDNASTSEILTGNYVYIPSINISAPVISGTTVDEGTILNQLKQGVLMYPGSSLPGKEGSTVIIGHSSSNLPWQKYGRIFSKLLELSEGDMIIVGHNGQKYSYHINKTMTGSIDQLSALNIQDDLVLGTCWPIGTDEKRIIVTATLVSSTID